MNRFARTARALALASLVALIATALAQGMMNRAPGSTTTPPGSAFGPMGYGMMGPIATQTVDEASFLVHMIPHHREAVASAEALRSVTQRPELLALADAIVTSQTAEIASMENWLDAWHPDAVRDVAYAPMMRDLGTDAAVADVERAFLEDMIGHHMMAVHESQTLLAGGLAEHAEVAALARSIVANQMNEMHQMATWLGAWYGADASTPMGMGPFGAMGYGGMGMRGTGYGATSTPEVGFGGMGMGQYGSTGYGAMGYGGMGMGQYGAMGFGRMGMGAVGRMYGESGGQGALHESMHGFMHGGDGWSSATVRPDEVERLVRAYLGGQGVDVGAAVLEASSLVYEVTVSVDGATQILRVDARTGAVDVAPGR